MSFNVPMSNVSMTLNADEFITSESAKLVFTATYALTDPAADAKGEILEAAKKLYNGEWFVTGVYREDSSAGIETVTYNLSIRVPENFVNSVRSGIKNVNRSGLKFELHSTDYTPTQAQIEEGNKSLRKKIYAKANEELEILNAETSGKDSDEKWVLGSVNFNNNSGAVSKANMLRTASTMMYESVGNAAGGGAAGDDDDGEAGVTQKLVLSASVNFTRKIYTRL